MTMRCGLFGKIGAKRDFIAIATPRSFLEAWEPWVQAALSASRHQLGPGWQQAFLTAPVWRFWLGAAICGTTVAGAIMPSLDGVGRYYPLTLHAVTGEGSYAAWYETWWDHIDLAFRDRDGGSWWHELDPDNQPSSPVWSGKPDTYHALQATLVTRDLRASARWVR